VYPDSLGRDRINIPLPEEFGRIKSEIGTAKIRNPNIEIRNKFQIYKCPNDQNNFLLAMSVLAFVFII